MPIIHKKPANAKIAKARQTRAKKPALVQGKINVILRKLKLAQTPGQRAGYMKALRETQAEFNKAKKNAA